MRTATFWLPGAEDDKVLGSISFHEDGSPRIVLQGESALVGRLQEALGTENGVIHGQARYDVVSDVETQSFGGPFTVFGPLPYGFYLAPDGLTEIELEPPTIAFGDHVDSPPTSHLAGFEINTLPAFLGHGFIHTEQDRSGPLPKLTIELEEWSAKASMSLVEIAVRQSTSDRWGRQKVVIARHAGFEATAARDMSPAEWQRAVVSPVEALLTLLLNRPAVTTRLGLWFDYDKDNPEQRDMGIFTKGISTETQPMSSYELVSAKPLARFSDGTPIEFEVLLPRWFAIWEQHRDAISLLLTDHGPQVSAELRFLSRVQAIEGLHRGSAVFPQTARPQLDHDGLIAKVKGIDVTNDERQWVVDRVKWNEPSLRRRLRDLCEPVESEPLGLILGGGRRTRELISIVVATRNRLTHRLHDTSDPNIWTTDYELSVLAEVLGVLMLTHILNWLGVDFQSQSDLLRPDQRFRFASDHFQPLFHQRADSSRPPA